MEMEMEFKPGFSKLDEPVKEEKKKKGIKLGFFSMARSLLLQRYNYYYNY